MGQFSWIDCQNEERAILDDVERDVYVLVPEEFGGGHIKEECYDGYGNFGGKDIFDLVALWNRKYIDENNLRKAPQLEDYREKEYYDSAVIRYKQSIQRLKDFSEGVSESKMIDKYGDEYLRSIGIDIACYDEQNASLKYPIKITYDKDAVYEDCEPSRGDPNQGWGIYSESLDKDVDFCTYEELKELYFDTDDKDILTYLNENFEGEMSLDDDFSEELDREY